MKIPTDKDLNSFQKPRSNWGAKKHGQPEAQYCLVHVIDPVVDFNLLAQTGCELLQPYSAWLCSHELVFSHLENHVPDIPSECNQIAAEA
jgi:hypothetical protein